MSEPIQARKIAERRKLHAIRDAILPAERAAAAQRLEQQHHAIAAMLPPGAIIGGYWPIKSELDPRPLMHSLAEAGFVLALPRMLAHGLSFHLYHAQSRLLFAAFGTYEPAADAPLLRPDLLLVPLLGFDHSGARLGYGKGYYDRAFGALPDARRIGLAFTCQEIAEMPVEPHDVRLHQVIVV